MFGPIKDIAQMLQRHGKSLDPTLLTLFDTLPKQWYEVKAMSMSAKEKLAPL